MGAWQTAPWVAIIAVIAILITAGYILITVRRVFFGSMPADLADHITDVSWMDKVAIGLLVVIMVAIGWFPALMTPMIQSTVNRILALVGGA